MTSETLIPLFSNSKVAESAVMAELENRGHLNLDELIGTYWPEFVSQDDEMGKADIKGESSICN